MGRATTGDDADRHLHLVDDGAPERAVAHVARQGELGPAAADPWDRELDTTLSKRPPAIGEQLSLF